MVAKLLAASGVPAVYVPRGEKLVQFPGAPFSVYAAVPPLLPPPVDVVIMKVQPLNPGVNENGPAAAGVPAPINAIVCGPVVVKTPALVNEIPLREPVDML